MTIYRGPGGTGEAHTDADVTEVRAVISQAEDYRDQAATSATNAAASAAASAASATSSSNYATNSANSAADAEASAVEAAALVASVQDVADQVVVAQQAAIDAAASEAAAAVSETNAASSASSAATSATAASTSATNAASSASSASTSAGNASSSASAASASATNAATQAGYASTYAANASNSATAAASSATTASNAASSASTSATNASNSAASASVSASSASTSASNAATSATSAASSATAAATSETNAASSATSAASSASAASTSASAAATSASNAATSETNAASSASSAASSATSAASSAAAAAASLDSFDDRYLGAKTSDPTVDNDGNALVTGALYYNSVEGEMRVYDGSVWIAASAASQAILVTYEYVATAGQTTFSGNDANGVSLAYTAGSIIVTLNGVKLRPGNDYTASNGTSVVLVSGAAAGDDVVIDAFSTFDVANTYTQAQVDAFAVKLTGAQTIAGVKTFSDNLGLGVTPSAWGSNYRAVEVSGAVNVFGNTTDANFAGIGANLYHNNTNYLYRYSTLATMYLQDNGTHQWHIAPSGTAGNAISFTQAMTLDASGNLGVGTTSPSYKLHVQMPSSGIGVAFRYLGGTNNPGLFFSTNESTTVSTIDASGSTGGILAFATSSVERARIDSSGNLLVGTTSSGASSQGFSLVASSDSVLRIGHANGTGSNSQYIQFNYNSSAIGSITQNGTTAVAYNTSSDYRLKENIHPMTGALAKVAALKPCTYKWKVDGSDGEGFIAHELAEVVPQCVTGEKDAVDADGKPVYQGIDTSFLVATLTAAIQEQQMQIADQLAIIQTLTARITALEAKQ